MDGLGRAESPALVAAQVTALTRERLERRLGCRGSTPSGTYAVLQLDKDSDCTETEIRQYKGIYEALKGVIQPNGDDENGEQTE